MKLIPFTKPAEPGVRFYELKPGEKFWVMPDSSKVYTKIRDGSDAVDEAAINSDHLYFAFGANQRVFRITPDAEKIYFSDLKLGEVFCHESYKKIWIKIRVNGSDFALDPTDGVSAYPSTDSPVIRLDAELHHEKP